tara:strand:- start:265 stop:1029 length:765 start_codon:yes stop_codon:yes gene_type:complete
MTDTTPQFSTTNTDYGDVLHATILKIFGDELTYNELEPYTRDKDDYSHLEVKEESNNHEGFMFVSVYIDKHKIMEKKYDKKWSYDVFYYLNELEMEENKKVIYKMSWYESKRHSKSHTDMYYEKEEHTRWAHFSELCRISVMYVTEDSNEYKSAINNSLSFMKSMEDSNLLPNALSFQNLIKSIEKKKEDRCSGCGRHNDFCICGDFMDFEEEIVKCMRCNMDMEKKEENKDGVWYSCDECLKQEEEFMDFGED